MTRALRRCLLLLCVASSGCGRDRAPEPVQPAATRAPSTPAPAQPATPALRSEREWALDLPTVAKDDIAAALAQANAALEAGRLERVDATPGALELYLAVLAADPARAAARSGLERTFDAMFERGRIAMRLGHLPEAARVAAIAGRVYRDHRDLAAYRQWLARAQAADAATQSADAAARAGRFDADDPKGAPANLARALAQLPGFEPARALREHWIDVRLALAAQAAGKGDYDAARAALATASAFRADAPAVLAMRLRIAELRESRTRRALARGHAAVRKLDLEQADHWLGVAKASAAQPAGVELLRERIFLARHYGPYAPGQKFADSLGPGVHGPEMVVVRFGRFRMGEDDDQRPHEGPEREVVFERGFALARNEVTVADFRRFIAATGYRTRATREGSSVVFDERGGSLTGHEGVDWRRDFLGRIAPDDRPVTHVAIEDAQAYVAWLAKRTGRAYRLPSEAEWEYALRAGQHTQYPWGDDAPPRAVGNLSGEGDKSSAGRSWGTPIRGYTDFFWGTAPVRSFPVERWGTYDLVGNVSEWTQDCWHEDYRRAPTDGSAWVNPGCPQHVVRGASWASALDQSRSASRMGVDATSTNPWLGFRVARDI